eukprot:scaffold47123_cov39-Attheya_sp.AAC.2
MRRIKINYLGKGEDKNQQTRRKENERDKAEKKKQKADEENRRVAKDSTKNVEANGVLLACCKVRRNLQGNMLTTLDSQLNEEETDSTINTMPDSDQDTTAEECADVFHADRNNEADRTEVDVAAGDDAAAQATLEETALLDAYIDIVQKILEVADKLASSCNETHEHTTVKVPVHHDAKAAYFRALCDAIFFFDADDIKAVKEVLRRKGRRCDLMLAFNFRYIAERQIRKAPI